MFKKAPEGQESSFRTKEKFRSRIPWSHSGFSDQNRAGCERASCQSGQTGPGEQQRNREEAPENLLCSEKGSIALKRANKGGKFQFVLLPEDCSGFRHRPSCHRRWAKSVPKKWQLSPQTSSKSCFEEREEILRKCFFFGRFSSKSPPKSGRGRKKGSECRTKEYLRRCRPGRAVEVVAEWPEVGKFGRLEEQEC